MAFNPNNYKPKEAKALPVILLLDVSGSMYGDKIKKLYDSTVEMIKTFSKEASRETVIKISIITFGASVELHTPYTSVVDLEKQGLLQFSANGMTPLGTALEMAKDMIEDKNIIPSNVYRPAVVLVSDGDPNDSWREPMDRFINDGRSSKCQRFAVGIGNDANYKMLTEFTKDSANVFKAENADDIVNAFSKVSMSVSVRSRSVNPNLIVPTMSLDNTNSNSDDEDEYI